MRSQPRVESKQGPQLRRHLRNACLAGGPAVLLATAAVAATQADGGIDEIVVTAQKREQRLQETPIAITALTGEGLEAASVGNVQEFGRLAPNVKLDVNRAGTQSGGPIYIRGVGQSDGLPGADPGVGVYVDGVYLGRSTGSMFDLVDIERVEVLRGPQGTLYGKNTIGGAINIISAEPTNEHHARVSVGAGNYGRLDGRVMFNAPLVDDKALMRVSAVHSSRDGYTENAPTGKNVDDKDTLGARVALALLPSDVTKILLSGDFTRSRNGMVAGRRVLPGTTIAQGSSDPFTGAYDLIGKADSDVYGLSATVTHDANSFTVKSITAYRGIDEAAQTDLDASEAAIVAQPLRDESQWQASQEFQLTGVALQDRLTWFTGVYYFQEQAGYRELSVINGGAATLDLTFGTDNRSYAVYGEGTYALTDRFNVTLGARYTRDSKELDIRFNAFGPASNKESWDSVTPRLVLDYKLTDDVFVYASAAKGFKSGQLNSRARSIPELQPLDPEQVWSYEVGAKTSWFDRRVTANLATFYTDYSDIQLQSFAAADNDVGFISTNAGKAHLYGLEIETIIKPLPSIDVIASLGLIRDNYDEYVDAAGIDRSDRRFENTPRKTYAIGGQYSRSLQGLGALQFRVDYSYQDDVFYDVTNHASLLQQGYELLSARIMFNSPNETWRVSAYGKNLAEEEYIVNGLNLAALLGGASFATFGAPRTYGLEVSYQF